MPPIFDIETLRAHYATLAARIAKAREAVRRPLTLTEKILFAHAATTEGIADLRRGEDYIVLRPDRVAMQDATAQMALLQFMNTGLARTAVPTTVHLDHLIRAERGAEADLAAARSANAEVYDFLRTAAARYGIGYWGAGAGIIHQVVLENYAFPGGMMVGTDSHTPNAGGLGMMAVGVGGADAVDVMAGMDWELRLPRVIGVRLTGCLSPWAAAKDVILHLAGLLTVKGGTNCVIEYFGDGAATLPATGKATICNMGAEVGATTSVFPFDEKMAAYLRATGRDEVAQLADGAGLQADPEVLANPAAHYDRVIDIDLSTVEPHANGPFTPDAACPVSRMRDKVASQSLPDRVEAALVGSCTNSSYQDITRVANVLRRAASQGLSPRAQLYINPGSERTRATLERDGALQTLREAGAIVLANACGPCIGQWKREGAERGERNTIVTSFNRNFVGRADGNPNTCAFVCSPEMVAAYALSGSLSFNPLTDSIYNKEGVAVRLAAPVADELPARGFDATLEGYEAPRNGAPEPTIREGSERLQRLTPFAPPTDGDFNDLHLLIKVRGKCTTDHISKAGPWLRYRGHLDKISDNLLLGAVNAFTGQAGQTRCALDGTVGTPAAVARTYKAAGIGTAIVAEDNYGEGSSREHAAMEPRHLGVRAVVAKSFARIHETNLKKQGVLALTFADPTDYDRVREDDLLTVDGLDDFTPESRLTLLLAHADGTAERLPLRHTYNAAQIHWLRAGSALGALRETCEER
ncbi:MAG: aconitate hydratase [Bacteroidaceae bacterium]|nr:aconitate hydratase [Bacteroidaceae bacterium]